MSTQAEEFVISMRDGVSGPAAAALAALNELEGSVAGAGDAMRQASGAPPIISGAQFSSLSEAKAAITSASESLRELTSQMKVMQHGPVVDVAQYRSLTAAISQQKGVVNAAQQAFTKMGGSATEAVDALRPAKDGVEGVNGSVKQLAPLLGPVAGKLSIFTDALSKMGPYGMAAAAALIVVGGAVAGLVSVIVQGISAAGALRDELLGLEGATEGNVAAAEALQQAIANVAQSSSLSRAKVGEYATQLNDAKLSGVELQNALEAMAIAGSAGGDKVAAAFLKDVQAAKAAGQSVDALSAKMKDKLGAVAAKQALSLGSQFAKLKESIADIFSGADIEPFLVGMQAVLSIFAADSDAAKSLKQIVTDTVNTAIGLMLDLAIAMATAYLAIRNNAVAWFAVKAVVYGVIAIFALLAAAVAAVVVVTAGAAALLAAPFIFVAAIVMAVKAAFTALWNFVSGITWADIGYAIVSALLLPVTAVRMLYDALASAWESMKGIDWSAVGAAIVGAILGALNFLITLPATLATLGVNMIMGLVNGILSAGPAVLGAITGVVSGGIAAAKNALLSHSPSQVFHDIGEGGIGAGMVGGIDASQSAVAGSSADLAGTAIGGAKGAVGADVGASKPAASGPTFQFNNCDFSGTSETIIEGFMRRVFATEAASAEPAT